MESLNKQIVFVSDDIQGFIRELERQNIKKLWMGGGAEIADSGFL